MLMSNLFTFSYLCFWLFCRYLIEKGANLEAVNNDGDLALDLAEGKEMEKLISEAMEKRGKDHLCLQWFSVILFPFLSFQ